MRPTDLIMKRRLGGELTRKEIACFVRGVTDGSFADYQLSAMLMAICLQGMSGRETVDLTMEMARSGEMLDLSATLIVAPLAAERGLCDWTGTAGGNFAGTQNGY